MGCKLQTQELLLTPAHCTENRQELKERGLFPLNLLENCIELVIENHVEYLIGIQIQTCDINDDEIKITKITNKS